MPGHDDTDKSADHGRRWRGLKAGARAQLEIRDYSQANASEQLASVGMEAGKVVAERANLESAGAWIPGVEIFPRTIYQQRHRGFFAEFARQGEGPLAELGLWPKQWATARMFAGTAKGFHVHPPYIPEGQEPEAWFQRLFNEEVGNVSLRPYDHEQWDVMFFVQGMIDMLLIDERAGMPRRRMRFVIFGDDQPGSNNVGVVIPAGVAHALHSASSTDCIMTYGTSTAFDPQAEGRMFSGIESKQLPDEWRKFFDA